MSILSELILKLKSMPENITQLEPFLKRVRDRYEVAEEYYNDISLVLTEAVNNSIIHGNKCKADKVVHISSKKEDNYLVFSIEDEGCGFDPSKIPDPTSPQNITKPNGRGVFLMNQLSDQVTISQTKNDCCCVEVRFKIEE